jgi:hypothetical protein
MSIVNLRGIDAAGHPSAAAVKAAGCNVVGFYLTGKFAPTSALIESYLAAGLGLISIFETGAQNALGAAAQATTDAHAALAAMASFKQPTGTAAVFTVDFDPTAAQLAAVGEYAQTFAGFLRAAKNLVTGYGGTATLQEVVSRVDYTWQAAGWSNGVLFPANIRQEITQITVGGVQCDQDAILKLPFGAWCSKGVYPPTPVPMTADEYCTVHGMVIIDYAEAEMCVFPAKRTTAKGKALPEIGWYQWNNTTHDMMPHSDANIPKTGTLYAFKANLDAAVIPHAGT